MKKVILPVFLTSLIFLCAAGLASAAGAGTFAGFPVVRLLLNGSPVTPDSPPVIINGRTYVPLRFVSESLGASVTWDEATRTAAIDTAAPVTGQPPVDTKPPITAGDKGVTATLVSVSADSSSIKLRLRIQNNSNVDVSLPISSAQIVADKIKLSHPGDYGSAFSKDIRPGETREGELTFPALPLATKEMRVFLEVRLDGPTNIFAPVFEVQL